MPDHIQMEICLDSAESALIAQKAGVDRVELCANLPEGGTTPSLGMMQQTRKLIQIAMMVIIRPRRGDFCYSDPEFAVMQADILAARQAGADGVVLGILHPDGTVDIQRTKALVELARPMQVTFHRAFDVTPDPLQALEDVIQSEADRILTSGQQISAFAGKDLIRKLIEQAASRIVIMPGAGINETNLSELLASTGAQEYHMSANHIVSGQMLFRPEQIRMGGNAALSEYDLVMTNPDKIIHCKSILGSITDKELP